MGVPTSPLGKTFWRSLALCPRIYITERPRCSLHVRMRGSLPFYSLLSETIWENGCWLAAEQWVPSQSQGHKSDQDSSFFKGLKIWYSKILQNNESVVTILSQLSALLKLQNKKSLRFFFETIWMSFALHKKGSSCLHHWCSGGSWK
jgi:hypothetical protein